MLFPYWEVTRGGERRWLPLIPITLWGTDGSKDVMALVDSGAEQNILSLELAEELGIDLEHSRPVTIVGAGEYETPGYLTEARLQLGEHRWTAEAIFSTAGDQRTILGQAGFFAEFSVTFRYSQGEMEIVRSKSSRPN